jgi:hypothetical protein
VLNKVLASVLVNALWCGATVGRISRGNEHGTGKYAQRPEVLCSVRVTGSPVPSTTYYELFPITSIRVVRHCPM